MSQARGPGGDDGTSGFLVALLVLAVIVVSARFCDSGGSDYSAERPETPPESFYK